MNKFKQLLSNKQAVNYTLFICINAALLYILYFTIKNLDMVLGTALTGLTSICSVLAPLFIGIVIAYILSPLVDMVDQKFFGKIAPISIEDPVKLEKIIGRRRFVSIFITFVLILCGLAALIYAFSVLIVGQFVFTGISSMVSTIVDYFMGYEEKLMAWVSTLPQNEISEKISVLINGFIAWLSSHFNASQLLTTIMGISSSIVNVVIGIVISIYLLKDKEFFIRLCRKTMHITLSQKSNAVTTEVLGEINGVVSLFIRGALLDAIIIAVLSSTSLSIYGLEFAVFIGCFAGLANIIPYFGPILGMIPAFIVGTFTDSLMSGIIAVVILLVIQQIDCNIIYPKIVGAATGLHPLFVLLAVTIAGYYGGIFAMIIAVPIAGILKIFIMRGVDYITARQESESQA